MMDDYFTLQYIPEDKSELHTRRRENLKSHMFDLSLVVQSLCRTTISNFLDRDENVAL
jgi:hypothetical protein